MSERKMGRPPRALPAHLKRADLSMKPLRPLANPPRAATFLRSKPDDETPASHRGGELLGLSTAQVMR